MHVRILLPFVGTALVLLGAAGPRAVDYPNAGALATPPVEQTPAGRTTVGTADNCAFLKVHDILGLSVKNRQGDDLGKIEDLVTDSTSGKIDYCVVAHGGMLGIGVKLIAVPYHDVSVRIAGDAKTRFALLDITKDQFAQAPSFTATTWPDMTSAAWATNTEKFFKEASMAARSSTERR